MSIFSDVFFPGNPERRRMVTELQTAIKGDFNNYKYAWNKLIDLLNDGFKASPQADVRQIKLVKLTKSIECDKPEVCAKEIEDAFRDFQSKFDVLAGLINLPADWKSVAVSGSDVHLNVDYLRNICKAVDGSCGVVCAAFVVWFTFSGIVTWGALAAGAVATVGGIVIVLLIDMIVGAITGAIERKELEKAISNLKEMRTSTIKLSTAALEINTIVQNIQKVKEGVPYAIDRELMVIWNNEKQRYEIINFVHMTFVAELAAA